ncbi:MAG: type II toxin-antitoxin system PemK/MazF family toxin [Rickettsiales bacterium]|nr:type II toxin-antitoxin system PemK/MazF family toxin [Rickettsiales bacterium]
MEKDYENWCKLKSKIDLHKKRPIFFEREIWWCNLGVNIGFEQDGKGKESARPILVCKKRNAKLLLVVPLSSKIKEDNPYYHKFTLNGVEQSAIIHQIKTIDSKRLLKKIARLSEKQFYEIIGKIKESL